MEFYEFLTMYDISKRIKKQTNFPFESDHVKYYAEFKKACIANIGTINTRDAVASFNQCLAEANYIENNRPYYNVYPTITKYLINLKEDKVPANLIRLPHRAIAFRFSHTETNFTFQDNNKSYSLRTVFVTYVKKEEILKVDGKDKSVTHDVMILWMDFGEVHTERISQTESVEVPIYTYKILYTDTNVTLEEAINASNKGKYEGLRIPDDIVNKVIRCVVSCCLISTDLEDGLIEPDVLSKDREKYQSTRDHKYVEKAIRRGKHGYLVGANLTISPHWRSGSPIALYWTGPGRTVPLYRPRKGAIVHRKQVKELPTGYADNV